MGLNGFILKKINKNKNIQVKKKSWEPFRICLLNSTANPSQFGWKTIETHARAFLTLIILGIATVAMDEKNICSFKTA